MLGKLGALGVESDYNIKLDTQDISVTELNLILEPQDVLSEISPN